MTKQAIIDMIMQAYPRAPQSWRSLAQRVLEPMEQDELFAFAVVVRKTQEKPQSSIPLTNYCTLRMYWGFFANVRDGMRFTDRVLRTKAEFSRAEAFIAEVLLEEVFSDAGYKLALGGHLIDHPERTSSAHRALQAREEAKLLVAELDAAGILARTNYRDLTRSSSSRWLYM